jgi:putative hemolysin
VIAASFGSLDLVGLLGVIVLLVIGLVLAIGESAFVRTSSTRIETLVDHEPARVQRVLRVLERPEEILNPLRLLILLFQVSEITLVTLLAARWVETPWVIVIGSINVCALFVLTEAVPRTLGILHAERAALSLGGPIVSLVALAPIRLLARGLIGLTNVLVPGRGLQKGPFVSPAEFIALADAAVEDDVIDEDERDLIESVIEFGDTIVREVMVPRTDMTTIELVRTVAEALEVTSEAGFSRVPVVGENIDDITGLVYVKDLIRAELDDLAEQTIEGFLRPAHFVPETKKVSELLKEMQRETFHMAVAVDEYGGIAGLVTLEDLIEELVGEIVDEYDVRESLVDHQRDGSLRVDARVPIGELNDLAGLELPEGDWATVGGLVFDSFGRIPSEGESCEAGGYELRVERVQGRRITRVSVLNRTTSESPS